MTSGQLSFIATTQTHCHHSSTRHVPPSLSLWRPIRVKNCTYYCTMVKLIL